MVSIDALHSLRQEDVKIKKRHRYCKFWTSSGHDEKILEAGGVSLSCTFIPPRLKETEKKSPVNQSSSNPHLITCFFYNFSVIWNWWLYPLRTSYQTCFSFFPSPPSSISSNFLAKPCGSLLTQWIKSASNWMNSVLQSPLLDKLWLKVDNFWWKLACSWLLYE